MRSRTLGCAALVFVAYLPLALAGAGTETKVNAPKLTADEIVSKNVAARGGLSTWRAVQTLQMKGKWMLEGTGGTRWLYRPRRKGCR